MSMRTKGSSVRRALPVTVAGALTAALVVTGTGAASAAPAPAAAKIASAAAVNLNNPTKALCKLKNYKIGYDVFSDSQPFAVSLSDGLKSAAASVGCAADRADG